MALFGIVFNGGSAAGGITISTATTNQTAETAEVRDQSGKVAEIKAYSKNTAVSIKGSVESAISINPGSVIVFTGGTFLVDSVDVAETNTGFVEVSLNAHHKDSSTLTVLS